MNWLIEIFSDNSDKARLVAILISAIVAILVVLLNQWFVSGRSKRELLVENIEWLFLDSNEYIFAFRESMDALAQQDIDHPRYYEYPG